MPNKTGDDESSVINAARVEQLADFFYASDSSADVPLRIACSTGRYTGIDLDRDGFISLFGILSKSNNLKEDLFSFLERYYER